MALKNFYSFVGDFKNVSSLIAKAALLAPFLDLLLNIGPPWPGRVGIATLTSLSQVLVLIYVFQFSTSLSLKKLQKDLKSFFIVLIVCFVCYITLYSFFVYDIPLTEDRDVKGFVVRPIVVKNLDMLGTIETALEGAEWDAFQIWEGWSVYTMRISLLLTWVLFFVSISGCIAVFVTAQRKDASRAKTKQKDRTSLPT